MKGSFEKKKKSLKHKQIRGKKLIQFFQNPAHVYSYPLTQQKIITNSSTYSIQFPPSLYLLIQTKFFPLQFVSEK